MSNSRQKHGSNNSTSNARPGTAAALKEGRNVIYATADTRFDSNNQQSFGEGNLNNGSRLQQRVNSVSGLNYSQKELADVLELNNVRFSTKIYE